MSTTGFDLAAKTVLFEQVSQWQQIMNARLTTRNHHMPRGISLPTNDSQQIFTARRPPLITLFGLRQNAEKGDFPILKLFPGVFGVAPGTANRASLLTNKNGGNAGKVTLTLQGLEHLVNRVLHSILCEVDNC